MRKVVITGATGVTGRALVSHAIREGYEVLAVVHRTSLRASDLEQIEGCRVLRLDLPEYGEGLAEMRRQGFETDEYEMYFHLAWMAPFGKDRENLSLQVDNIKASLNAVEMAKGLGCHTFIGIGSQSEYGRTNEPLGPMTPTFPETGYGIAKLCTGQLTRLKCEQMGLKHIWTRVLSVYGPYDRDQTLITDAVIHMMNNEETSFSPCEQIWDYLYSDDVARAIWLTGVRGQHGRVYVAGSGKTRLLKEYIIDIARITGYQKEIGFGKRSYNDRQVMHLQAEPESLRSLGFQPEISFEEGILRMIQWLRKRDEIKTMAE